MTKRARRQIMCQFFNEIAAAPRVDDFGGVAFHLQHKLRVARDTRREFGWQCNRFVEGIGVQRLRAAEYGCHRLNRRTHDIVVRVLLGQ